MPQVSENLFANYGDIVYGTRFLGRKGSLQAIADRVIIPAEPGNLAIVGMPRIGKSSLAYRAVIECKDELHTRRMLPLWVNVSTYDGPEDFFRSLVTDCLEELKGLSWVTPAISNAASRALQASITWGERYERMQRFFAKVRQTSVRVLFVLDGFDKASDLFRNDPSSFRKLRELAYQPEWRVTFITTSCHTIREIEQRAGAEPMLAATFHELYLGMFNEEEVREYFERLAMADVPISPALKGDIHYYSGRHPYLLEMLGYQVVELFRQGEGTINRPPTDVDRAARAVDQELSSYMTDITEVVREDGLLSTLLQALFHANVQVRQSDLDRLLRYGFLIEVPHDGYIAFSSRFQTFLRGIGRDTEPLEAIQRKTEKLPETVEEASVREPVDLWPIWRKTEKMLRRALNGVLQRMYGENWDVRVEELEPMLFMDESGKNVFQRCREFQRKEEQIWGSRASKNLLDYTLPQELFAIVFSQWHVFQPIFGKDVPYWRQRVELLGKVRAPLAHNRDEVISDEERVAAEEYCQEILAALSAIEGGSNAQTH